MIEIASLVEGQGEISALPILIRRIVQDFAFVNASKPVRIQRHRLLKAGELERQIDASVRRMHMPARLLLLLDSDDDCPKELAPALVSRAQMARPDAIVSVVLAQREFESWFLTAAESLRGIHGLPDDLRSPQMPETIRGAKEWLTRQMPPGHPYDPVVHQAAFATTFDIQAARRSRSFDKPCREVVHLTSL